MNYNVLSQDVEGMLSISVEATAAHNSLSDDKELINTYEVESLFCILFFNRLNFKSCATELVLLINCRD